MDNIRLRSANTEAERSYKAVLTSMVAAVSQDHAQVRALIYESPVPNYAKIFTGNSTS